MSDGVFKPDEFYDEDGVHHWHQIDGSVFALRCENGHVWFATRFSECGCGWRAADDTDELFGA